MNRARSALHLPFVLGLSLVACEQGSGVVSASTPVSGTPGIALFASISELEVPRGWNALIEVAISRTSGMTGPVTLTFDSMPVGVSGTFAVSLLGPASTATRANVEVDSLMVPGKYEFVIRASAPGVTQVSIPIRVTVPRPSFQILLFPPELVITQALPNAGTLMIAAVTRENGLRGDITLAFTGLPTSVLSATSVLRDGALLPVRITFTANPNAAWPAVGTSTATLRASARDAEDLMIAIPVRVKEAPPEMTLQVQPSELQIARNATGETETFAQMRQGLPRYIDRLDVTGMPPGVVVDVVPVDFEDFAYCRLVVRVGNAVAAGTYVLTINARLNGTPADRVDATARLTLNVP